MNRIVSKLSLVVALALALFLASGPSTAAGLAHAVTALNAVTSPRASAWVQTGAFESVQVHLFSATTSTSTVTIEQSADCSTPYVVATVTNVAAAGALYVGPAAGCTRLNASALSAGAVTGLIIPSNVHYEGGWKLLDANPATTSSLTSVGLAMPGGFSVSGSPLTANGTITVTSGTTLTGVTGTGAANWHLVKGEAAMSSGGATVTLSGAAVYTGNTTYTCTANTKSATAGSIKALGVTYTSGTAFVIKSADAADTQTAAFVCVGN